LRERARVRGGIILELPSEKYMIRGDVISLDKVIMDI